MSISLAVFLAQVDGLISANNDEISQLRRERLIKQAVERYSSDAPDDVIEDESGDGGKYYAVATLLGSWIEGFSRITKIEYPAASVASDEMPVYLEPEDWDDNYWAGGTRYLYLPLHAPAATETMRITYTVPYLWSQSTTTQAHNVTGHGFSVGDYLYREDGTWIEASDSRIATHIVSAVADVDNFTVALLQADVPVSDFFAVCNLAAGMCCQAIATKYSRTSDSTMNLDSVDHPSRGREFAARAKEFIKLYETHMGLNEKPMVHGAGEFVDWNTSPEFPQGGSWLYHRRGNR